MLLNLNNGGGNRDEEKHTKVSSKLLQNKFPLYNLTHILLHTLGLQCPDGTAAVRTLGVGSSMKTLL